MSNAIRSTLFVTGAAAGIGRAVAEHFLRKGWFVGLYDVDEAGLLALQQDWGPEHCTAARLDVSSVDDWHAALQGFEQATGGRLDVLFNNAGIAVTSPFAEAELARHHRLIDINLKGVVNGCYLALPWLQRTPGSRVINMITNGPRKKTFLPQLGQLKRSIGALVISNSRIAAAKANVECPHT